MNTKNSEVFSRCREKLGSVNKTSQKISEELKGSNKERSNNAASSGNRGAADNMAAVLTRRSADDDFDLCDIQLAAKWLPPCLNTQTSA